MVLPQGAFHMQINPTCETVTATAAFSSDDEGFLALAPSLFALNDSELENIFGQSLDGATIATVRKVVSQGFMLVEECQKTCGF